MNKKNPAQSAGFFVVTHQIGSRIEKTLFFEVSVVRNESHFLYARMMTRV